MLATKDSIHLGIQPIPPFAREVTLVQLQPCWDAYEGYEADPFPLPKTIYNIAALGFFSRIRMQPNVSPSFVGMVGISYWSWTRVAGIKLIFGEDKIQIPQGAEYYGVSWAAPPEWSLATPNGGPYPEDMFRTIWGLAI